MNKRNFTKSSPHQKTNKNKIFIDLSRKIMSILYTGRHIYSPHSTTTCDYHSGANCNKYKFNPVLTSQKEQYFIKYNYIRI